jgi:two-component system LytT family response regulator
MTPAKALRVLVADDERLARQRLEDLLAHEENIEIVGRTDNGPSTVAAIRELEPDLVFLDIQMPGKTGLEIVREIGAAAMPPVIFTTAYDHAVAAFDLAAIDYLIKPFD